MSKPDPSFSSRTCLSLHSRQISYLNSWNLQNSHQEPSHKRFTLPAARLPQAWHFCNLGRNSFFCPVPTCTKNFAPLAFPSKALLWCLPFMWFYTLSHSPVLSNHITYFLFLTIINNYWTHKQEFQNLSVFNM